jgi:hypothetical protein
MTQIRRCSAGGTRAVQERLARVCARSPARDPSTIPTQHRHAFRVCRAAGQSRRPRLATGGPEPAAAAGAAAGRLIRPQLAAAGGKIERTARPFAGPGQSRRAGSDDDRDAGGLQLLAGLLRCLLTARRRRRRRGGGRSDRRDGPNRGEPNRGEAVGEGQAVHLRCLRHGCKRQPPSPSPWRLGWNVVQAAAAGGRGVPAGEGGHEVHVVLAAGRLLHRHHVVVRPAHQVHLPHRVVHGVSCPPHTHSSSPVPHGGDPHAPLQGTLHAPRARQRASAHGPRLACTPARSPHRDTGAVQGPRLAQARRRRASGRRDGAAVPAGPSLAQAAPSPIRAHALTRASLSPCTLALAKYSASLSPSTLAVSRRLVRASMRGRDAQRPARLGPGTAARAAGAGGPPTTPRRRPAVASQIAYGARHALDTFVRATWRSRGVQPQARAATRNEWPRAARTRAHAAWCSRGQRGRAAARELAHCPRAGGPCDGPSWTGWARSSRSRRWCTS